MNPFRKIANSLMNWWKGETAPEVSDSTELTGGVMTLNSPSFLESMGLSRRRKTTSEVTYFTCLKMLSETLAKMPIKYYQRTDKGIIEAEQTDTSRLLTKRPNPFMTPTVFWNTVEINRNHYGNAYVYMRKKFIRKKYGGEVKILDLWVMQSNCVQIEAQGNRATPCRLTITATEYIEQLRINGLSCGEIIIDTIPRGSANRTGHTEHH